MSSELRVIKCLEWSTELPSRESTRTSPVFYDVKGNIYLFRFVLEKGVQKWYYRLYMELKIMAADFKPRSGNIRAEYRMQNTLSLEKKAFEISEPSSKEIWCISMQNLKSKALDADLMLDHRMKFLLHFDDNAEPIIKNSEEIGNKCLQTGSDLNADIPTESANDDPSQLLDSDEIKDAEIKCGEHSIKVHQLILSARSEVFKAMLESNMLQGQTSIIEIQDMDSNYLEDFVRYLYTGTIPELTLDKAKVFYEAGEKYAVHSLMLRCSEYLQDNLTRENAFQCFALANAHSDHKLKNRVKTFILEEKMYFEDKFWLPFAEFFPKFAVEVYRLSLKRKNSESEVL